MEHALFKAHFNTVMRMMKEGYDQASIEAALRNSGVDVQGITDIFTAVRRMKNSRRTQNGNMLIVAGALLLVLGFGVCVALHYMDIQMTFALYGFTTAGLVLLFTGLVKIFQ